MFLLKTELKKFHFDVWRTETYQANFFFLDNIYYEISFQVKNLIYFD